MNEQSIRFPLRKTRKIGFELTGLADWKRFYFDIARLSCDLNMFKQSHAEKRGGVHEHCDPPRNRQDLGDQLEFFAASSAVAALTPVTFPPGRARLAINPVASKSPP